MRTAGDIKVVLIIDDDRLLCDVVREFLEKENLKVLAAHTCAEGISIYSQNKVDIVLLDQNLPDGEGYELCPSILKYYEHAKIIFITAFPSFDNAVKAIKGGANDYLSKPFEMEELSLAVRQALKMLNLEKVAQIENYRKTKESEKNVIVGSSKEFTEILSAIDLAASTDAPVLITGETGTGKSVVAKAIHFKSKAREGAFISINCAALPENLIESELFGYEKGAFTGAATRMRGIFEMAEGGTLLLDEIGEMPVHLQTRLLNVLEDKKIKRLGGDVFRPVNFRIIAATSADLGSSLGRNFRSDLYYRLSVMRIHIPPLRERRQDIPEICAHFLNEIASGHDIALDKSEKDNLMAYDWPGNVRELRNILERAFLLRKNSDLHPSDLLGERYADKPQDRKQSVKDAIMPLQEVEKKYVHEALERLLWNYTKTAKTLKISLSTLKRKIREYGLKRP